SRLRDLEIGSATSAMRPRYPNDARLTDCARRHAGAWPRRDARRTKSEQSAATSACGKLNGTRKRPIRPSSHAKLSRENSGEQTFANLSSRLANLRANHLKVLKRVSRMVSPQGFEPWTP